MCKAFFYGCYLRAKVLRCNRIDAELCVCNSVVKFYRRANLVCLGILSLHSVLNLRACLRASSSMDLSMTRLGFTLASLICDCGGPDAAVNMIVCFIMANRRIASYVLAHMAL